MEDTATGSLTRTIRCIDGNLAATTAKTGGTILQLVNLHGDVALALSADTALVPTVLDSDEYGNARTGQAAARYSWAGGKQRSDETLTGLTLMGVRLYDASTGRFLQTDPVVGGNENSYVYPADPIRMYELTGMYRVYWGWSYVTITLNSRENNNLAAGGGWAAAAIGGLKNMGFVGPNRVLLIPRLRNRCVGGRPPEQVPVHPRRVRVRMELVHLRPVRVREGTMKNPLGDNGILTRAIPWISLILVTALTASAITSDLSVVVKTLAALAALAVTARSLRQIVKQAK
ncbi:RHS repeat-associated core domain-containing protein [Streptomyces sp. NBC_00161]|uniref:RHS repeat-associated core domain-containing protein n=1 Tax=Streptomyces sp. NBC_00161 TaxID=2975671 RepID=UPI003864CCFD